MSGRSAAKCLGRWVGVFGGRGDLQRSAGRAKTRTTEQVKTPQHISKSMLFDVLCVIRPWEFQGDWLRERDPKNSHQVPFVRLELRGLPVKRGPRGLLELLPEGASDSS